MRRVCTWDTTITEEDNYGGMYWYEPGTCAPICAEGEFLNHDYKCEAKRQARRLSF